MTKEFITLIHLNNVINDLSTTISKATNDGVSTKLFNQLITDLTNIVKDNPTVSELFQNHFVKFIQTINTDVNSRSKQSQVLSKIVMFNSRYMSKH